MRVPIEREELALRFLTHLTEQTPVSDWDGRLIAWAAEYGLCRRHAERVVMDALGHHDQARIPPRIVMALVAALPSRAGGTGTPGHPTADYWWARVGSGEVLFVVPGGPESRLGARIKRLAGVAHPPSPSVEDVDQLEASVAAVTERAVWLESLSDLLDPASVFRVATRTRRPPSESPDELWAWVERASDGLDAVERMLAGVEVQRVWLLRQLRQNTLRCEELALGEGWDLPLADWWDVVTGHNHQRRSLGELRQILREQGQHLTAARMGSSDPERRDLDWLTPAPRRAKLRYIAVAPCSAADVDEAVKASAVMRPPGRWTRRDGLYEWMFSPFQLFDSPEDALVALPERYAIFGVAAATGLREAGERGRATASGVYVRDEVDPRGVLGPYASEGFEIVRRSPNLEVDELQRLAVAWWTLAEDEWEERDAACRRLEEGEKPGYSRAVLRFSRAAAVTTLTWVVNPNVREAAANAVADALLATLGADVLSDRHVGLLMRAWVEVLGDEQQ